MCPWFNSKRYHNGAASNQEAALFFVSRVKKSKSFFRFYQFIVYLCREYEE